MPESSGNGTCPSWAEAQQVRDLTDIFWACFVTIGLCLFTMLHPNLPARTDGFRVRFFQKLRWAILGLFAPEVPMLFACGQYSSAARSVESMNSTVRRPDDLPWTIEHAFYADAGGFVVQFPDYNSGEPFPISAKQLEYLIKHNFVPYPTITREEIMDKSNGDHVSKFITIFETSWFILHIIARAASRLPITALEFETLSIICCSFTTAYYWRNKPLDIGIPTLITLTCPLSAILDTAIPPSISSSSSSSTTTSKPPPLSPSPVSPHTYTSTPLDFIEPNVYMSRKWSRTLLRHLEHSPYLPHLQQTPLTRIPNDRDPQLNSIRQHITLGIATALFASIHFLAWDDSHFPTPWEAVLWRACCLTMWVLLAVYGTSEVYICWREGYVNMGLDTAGGYKKRFPACLLFFVPAGLYMVARLGVIFEALASMRRLPDDVFVAVEWTSFIPHVS